MMFGRAVCCQLQVMVPQLERRPSVRLCTEANVSLCGAVHHGQGYRIKWRFQTSYCATHGAWVAFNFHVVAGPSVQHVGVPSAFTG